MTLERLFLDSLPGTSPTPLTVRVTRGGEHPIHRGHPLVYEESVQSVSREGVPGDTAAILDRKGRLLAMGLYDPVGPFRIHILQTFRRIQVGPTLFADRIARALKRRQALVDAPETDGWRVVNGEGDGLPGLVVDRYGETFVLKLKTGAWVPHLPHIVDALKETCGPAGIIARASSIALRSPVTPSALHTGAIIYGEPETGPVPFLEHGLQFEAQPLGGRRTGFRLDQRENRAEVRRMARGARVLVLFSDSRAYPVAAAAGGAVSVVSVSRRARALEQANRNMDLNPEVTGDTDHRVIAGKVLELLEGWGDERFDLVIVDPPPLARRRSQREEAITAYQTLARLALGVLEPGGLLVHGSRSGPVESTDFFAAVHAGAQDAGRPLTEEFRREHPVDHPWRPPGKRKKLERGRYLKCLYARG